MPEVQPSVGQAQQPRRGILRRISSPFSTQSRSVADFIVQADDPHRRYGPGDVVSGSTILKLVKPTRITHIVVALHGYVQVYKSPGAPPPEGFRASKNVNGRGKSERRGLYFGNGFASLFEDEVVVCGDGRLEEGFYQFRFDLRFPKEMLPGSIDFERGTVTYMLTTTMTRPNTMSPVSFHDQKLYYNERIDIAQYQPPKLIAIHLEPVLRKAKSKSKTPSSRRMTISDRSSSDNASSQRSLARLATEARSPSPNRGSTPTRNSAGSSPDSVLPASEPGSYARSRRTSESTSVRTLMSASGAEGRLITVSVQPLRGGVLRGEFIPLDIHVEHIKAVRSMQGVIVTLFRQARVDTHPAVPTAPLTENESRRREDYYPKSITGLGGLSLSAAGSSHVFRKDLSQMTMPLFVDPYTLRADLRAKIRVPEEAFPTIARVPGQMLQFKYYVEVIIDVQGKFRSPEKHHSQPKSNQFADITLGNPMDPDGRRADVYMHNSDYTPHIDTDTLRRDKTVASCVMEVIIGTENSQRNKGKERAESLAAQEGQPPMGTSSLRDPYRSSSSPVQYALRNGQIPARTSPNGAYAIYDDGDLYAPGYDGSPAYVAHHGQSYEQPPEFVPEDAMYDEGLTEKQRLQRAEAALLPSQPPEDDFETATSSHPPPPLLNEPDANSMSPSEHAPGHIVWADTGSPGHGAASAPGYMSASSATAYGEHAPVDTKDDLRRLEEQASAPPMDDEEETDHIHAARVPRLEDLEGPLHHLELDTTTADLPRYER